MMTNRERLEENAADSILALLMDDYAQSEGERYIKENERLQADPEAEVPKDVERRALQRIEQEFAKNSRKQQSRSLLRLLGRVAIAALIAILLFTAAFALSPAFRVGTLNLLMRIDAQVATWQFVPENWRDDDSIGSKEKPLELEIGWLPEGFTRKNPLFSGPNDLVIDCTNDSGSMIRVSVHESEDYLHIIDLEDSDYYESIFIHGCEGILIYKSDVIRVNWVYSDSKYVVCIESNDENLDTILRVAESITLIQ